MDNTLSHTQTQTRIFLLRPNWNAFVVKLWLFIVIHIYTYLHSCCTLYVVTMDHGPYASYNCPLNCNAFPRHNQNLCTATLSFHFLMSLFSLLSLCLCLSRYKCICTSELKCEHIWKLFSLFIRAEYFMWWHLIHRSIYVTFAISNACRKTLSSIVFRTLFT